MIDQQHRLVKQRLTISPLERLRQVSLRVADELDEIVQVRVIALDGIRPRLRARRRRILRPVVVGPFRQLVAAVAVLAEAQDVVLR